METPQWPRGLAVAATLMLAVVLPACDRGETSPAASPPTAALPIQAPGTSRLPVRPGSTTAPSATTRATAAPPLPPRPAAGCELPERQWSSRIAFAGEAAGNLDIFVVIGRQVAAHLRCGLWQVR